MPPHPAGTGGPEGAGLPARQAQPPGRGARPGGRHSGRGWSGASAGHSDDGGQAGVAIPISLVGPPRRGEARRGAAAGGASEGQPRRRACRDRDLFWRWAGSGGGTLAGRAGAALATPAVEKLTKSRAGVQAASSCLGGLGDAA